MNGIATATRTARAADGRLVPGIGAPHALLSNSACGQLDNEAVAKQAEVAILLCTFEGQRFLRDQLESFHHQSYPHWKLRVSDDGSQDDTWKILGEYRQKWGAERLAVNTGPRLGYSTNFLSLACEISIDADYYAFSDQDDIWGPHKLTRALSFLEQVPSNVPALYCSRTTLVDEHNHDLGHSPLFVRQPSFANALVQNIAGGNTMVFNKTARALLCTAGSAVDVVSHDWWAYMLIAGGGGHVYYDPEPSVRYRQHDGNAIGSSTGWSARMHRLNQLWQGRFRNWNDRNIAALMQVRELLTDENRKMLDEFAQSRNETVLPRTLGVWRSRVYRQTVLGNLGLIAGTLLKKI